MKTDSAVSPTVGVLSLSLWGFVPWNVFGYAWLTWWLGDAAGAIIAAPLCLAWLRPEPLGKSPWRGLELALLGGLTIALCRIVFFGNRPFEYGLIPLLLWAAFRFGMRGAASGAALIAVFATVGTSRGTSPFVAATVNESLLLLHSFLAVTIICALVLAGVLNERRQVEAERARLATAVQQAGEAIVITDTDGTIQYVNPAFERITGYAQPEAVGKNPRMLRSGTHEPAFYEAMWRTLLRGDVWSGRIVNRRKDGTRLDLDTTIAPIRDPAGTVRSYVAVQHDVTHQVAMEAHLRQAQKMESVGQLAGGVAHDFNNLLTVIQGNAALLLVDGLAPPELAAPSNEILQACKRAASLTRQLLLFSRVQVMRSLDLDLNEVVRGTSKMLARLLGEEVSLRTELAPTALPLRADAAMLEQVLMNLALNGRDAMPGGGHLTISTGEAVVDEEQAQENPEATAGPAAWLEVADTGQGIGADVMPRIFEPFFTTKDVGKGTGLGLSTVHGIVKQHRGWITVDTQIGRGTAFRVWLPLAPAVQLEPAASSDTADLARGRETILLAEDEAPVRRLTSDVMRRCGYTVLEAESGPSALAIWAEHGPRVDLLFTDLVMPGGMDGFELARRLRADKPALKVLFTTGYRRAGQGSCEPVGDPMLQKPYSPQQLSQALRACLDERQGERIV